MKKNEEKSALIERSKDILDNICGTCETVLINRKRMGNKKAYNYCIRDCPTGKELSEIGEKLLKIQMEERK